MPRVPTSALIALLAGTAAADSLPESPLGFGHGTPIAHIYYNPATGERVATLLGDSARPADAGGTSEVWVSDNMLPCTGFGQTQAQFGVMFTPPCSTCFSGSTGLEPILSLDWADIAFDQVVDCVSVAWATASPDVDADGDGIGDGVRGLGGFWTWYDADNGYFSDTRLGVMSLGLFDLPGYIGTDATGVAIYTATIDLPMDQLAFEIGDTDSASPTINFNPHGGIDLDGDTRADYAYSLSFTHPGTYDWDGDGVVDGEPSRDVFGWPLAVGPGQVLQHPDGSFSYEPSSHEPGDTGAEDLFDMWFDVGFNGVFVPLGTFSFGGLHCSPSTDLARPFAQFYSVLYGPSDTGSCCPVDIFPEAAPGQPVCANADGVLNVFDITTFIAWYNSGDTRADLAAPAGTLNFFDIAAFIAAYGAGCP